MQVAEKQQPSQPARKATTPEKLDALRHAVINARR
jgi:hypothetical protein